MDSIVITLVKNDFDAFEITKKSILEQTLMPVWLVIDSSDDLNYINIEGLPFARKLYVPANGIYESMNEAIRFVKNSFNQEFLVIFLNSGDTFADIEAIQHFSNLSNGEWFYWDYYLVDSISKTFKLIKPVSWNIKRQLFAKKPISHQALAVKLKFFEVENSFDCKFKSAADWDFIVRLSQKSTGEYIPAALTNFVLGGYSSQNRISGTKELFELRKKYLGKSKWLELRSYAYFVKSTLKNRIYFRFLNNNPKLLYLIRKLYLWR